MEILLEQNFIFLKNLNYFSIFVLLSLSGEFEVRSLFKLKEFKEPIHQLETLINFPNCQRTVGESDLDCQVCVQSIRLMENNQLVIIFILEKKLSQYLHRLR